MWNGIVQPEAEFKIFENGICTFLERKIIGPTISLDNKGSCWILLDFYCSVTMLRKLRLMALLAVHVPFVPVAI